jgi:Mn-dependent DtxR family transcriptional regulator
VSRTHVSRRLSKLSEHGLLHTLANGVYTLTDEGEAYLAGEYDAENGVYLDETGDSSPSASGEPTGI